MCAAKTKKCHKCGNVGHFIKCCKTNGTKAKFKRKGHVRHVDDARTDDEDDECLYAFHVESEHVPKHVREIG